MQWIRNPRDFYAGLMFMAFGLAAIVLSGSYPVGEASRMGPGYMPRALGMLLLVFGAVLGLKGFASSDEEQPTWNWRPLFIVLLAVGLFSLAAKWLGVIAASIVLIFVASAASREFRWKEALASGAILGTAAVAVFVYGLGIPLRIWPAFIGSGP